MTPHLIGSLFPLVAAMVALTGCSQADDGAPATTNSAAPELAHVHGLGVDPADGTLYAASHHGVFRVPTTGEPKQVSETQDTMGFTVVGRGHFLGSGHPAPDDTTRPPHLGLIKSTDAGRTWKSLSLEGEADFHALEAKHNRMYGYDSQTQQLMVSTNGTTWDRRARLAMADFDVDPVDPAVLLATTEQGVARSTDGGRTFAPLPNAPALLLVDWPTASTLVGVAPDGTVYQSPDSGATWAQQGTVPGAPEALATHESDVYLATESGIHRSHDGGRTFGAVSG